MKFTSSQPYFFENDSFAYASTYNDYHFSDFKKSAVFPTITRWRYFRKWPGPLLKILNSCLAARLYWGSSYGEIYNRTLGSTVSAANLFLTSTRLDPRYPLFPSCKANDITEEPMHMKYLRVLDIAETAYPKIEFTSLPHLPTYRREGRRDW